MYQEFSVVNILPITSDKQIIIETNKAINTLNQDNIVIELYDRKTKTPVLFDYCIDFKKLIITLKDWPLTNNDYILGVRGLISVADETLENNIKKKIVFNSSVISTVSILSPVMFEKVNDLKIKLKENAVGNEELVNSFYVEIARDTAFINISNKFSTVKDEADIFLKEQGQYFIRARVQKDNENYGDWSEKISFIYKNDNSNNGETNNSDDDIYVDVDINDDKNEPDIEINDPLIITNMPEQGITPDSGFLFIFNNKIDDFSVDDIVIIREDVR